MGNLNLKSFSVTEVVIFTITIALSLSVLLTQKAFAVSTSTLPQGIRSPMVKMGVIQGLEQRYTEEGRLVRLTDYKSIEFDAATLSQFSYEAQTLITSLNRFGVFGLGDSLNLGVLEISAKPQINYTAPVFAYGISNNWTVAIATPFINYRNRIKLSQSFSNIEYYRTQFNGLSPELDEALNTDLGQAVQTTLVNKGYDPLVDREQSFLGDVQLISVLKILDKDNRTAALQSTLTLPTGPQYDSDDLLALNSFHKLSLENIFAVAQKVGPYFTLTPYAGLTYVSNQKITMRVPKNENDIIPDESTKEAVSREAYFTQELGLKTTVHFNDEFELNTTFKRGSRGKDKISGDRNSRYDLLEKDTESSWQKISLDLNYSTVKSYFNKTSALPMIAMISVFDTIAGKNIERQQGQEITLTLFF